MSTLGVTGSFSSRTRARFVCVGLLWLALPVYLNISILYYQHPSCIPASYHRRHHRGRGADCASSALNISIHIDVAETNAGPICTVMIDYYDIMQARPLTSLRRVAFRFDSIQYEIRITPLHATARSAVQVTNKHDRQVRFSAAFECISASM